MVVNISDKISSEIVKAVQETGLKYAIVPSRFTDIVTDKFLLVIREPSDISYIEPVLKKANDMNKAFVLVFEKGFKKKDLDSIVKGLVGNLRVNIPIINLLTPEMIGDFVNNLAKTEHGRGGFSIGEIQFTPSYLVDVVGVNINQAKAIIKKFPTLEFLKQAREEDLKAISGIGDATAKKIVEALK